MERVAQIQVVHSDRAQLEGMVQDLLERRLIACGQLLGPLESVFRWQGELQHEREWLALLKTAEARAGEVLARVRELHSYEVPEVLVTEVDGGAHEYLQWVLAETAPPA